MWAIQPGGIIQEVGPKESWVRRLADISGHSEDVIPVYVLSEEEWLTAELMITIISDLTPDEFFKITKNTIEEAKSFLQALKGGE
jgi:hypothetical protein